MSEFGNSWRQLKCAWRDMLRARRISKAVDLVIRAEELVGSRRTTTQLAFYRLMNELKVENRIKE